MGTPFERDMDFIRDLLMRIEGGERIFQPISREAAEILGLPADEGMSTVEADKLTYHLALLEEAGLVRFTKVGGGGWIVEGITWDGHDLLDSIRDSKVWKKTKSSAAAAGGFTVGLLKDLAKGFVKKQIEEHTGVKL